MGKRQVSRQLWKTASLEADVMSHGRLFRGGYQPPETVHSHQQQGTCQSKLIQREAQ